MNWRTYAFGGLAAAAGAAAAIAVRAWVESSEPQAQPPVEERKPTPEEVPSDGTSVEQAASKIQSYTNRIATTAAAMGPENRKALFATQRVFAKLAPLVAAYEAALRDLNQAGGATPATLKSREDLAARIGLVRQFMSAGRSVWQFYSELEKNFGNELAREKLPESTRREVLVAFRRGASIDENLLIRDCDREIGAGLLEVLELLRRYWGGWSVRGSAILFEEDAMLGEYLAIQEKVRLATERQQQAQKQLRDRIGTTAQTSPPASLVPAKK
jgi:hypothetical protein